MSCAARALRAFRGFLRLLHEAQGHCLKGLLQEGLGDYRNRLFKRPFQGLLQEVAPKGSLKRGLQKTPRLRFVFLSLKNITAVFDSTKTMYTIRVRVWPYAKTQRNFIGSTLKLLFTHKV